MAFDTSIWRLPPAIVCPKKECGTVLGLAAYFPGPYFRGEECKCSDCGNIFDLWGCALEVLKKKNQFFRTRGAAFIGAREIIFTFQLPPNQYAEVDLSGYGMPEDAKIVCLSATANAGAGFPIQIHPGFQFPNVPKHKISFYGKPFHDHEIKQGNGRHDVDMSVTYIPRTPDHISFEHLADAYEKFLADDYEDMILPCAVGLEYALERITAEALREIKLPDNLEPNKRISLQVILPLICRRYGAPQLDNKIVQLILRLWRLRGQMAHKGFLEENLDLATAAQLMAAAMFGLNYLVLFGDIIKTKMFVVL